VTAKTAPAGTEPAEAADPGGTREDTHRAEAPGARSRGAAFVVAALAAGVTVACVPLLSLSHQWKAATSATLPVTVACLAVGLLLALKRPRNVMGWCLLGGTLFFALNIAASAYAIFDYRFHDGALAMGWVAVLLQPSWAPAIVLFSVTVLLFPDGTFPSGTSRWAVGLLLAVGGVWLLGAFAVSVDAVATHAVHVDPSGTLHVLNHPTGAWAWWSVVQDVFFITLAANAVAWLVQIVARFRRTEGDARLQLKWLIGGAVVAIVGGGLAVGCATASGSGTSIALQVFGDAGGVATAALPVALAVAVTRYRLYDIDRIISRTVSYVLVTALVVGGYVGLVTLTSKTIGFSSPVAVAVSTLCAAALFAPVRRRTQRVIDRRFNRARYDTERTVSGFAWRLRDAVDPDTVRTRLEETVATSLEPSTITVWVSPFGRP